MAPKATYEVIWKGKEIGAAATKRLKINAERVGRFLEGRVVKLISVGQPAIRSSDGSMFGLEPSTHPNPPKLLTGRLRASIDHRAERQGGYVTVFLSAGTDYARKLEMGEGKFKSRPFLRRTINENKGRAINMLVKGLFQEKQLFDRRRLK
jgi:HK97 gp10 family phage protein